MADKKGILYNEAAKAYFYGDCVSSIEPYGGGHINDTFLARTEKGNFVLQRVNGYDLVHKLFEPKKPQVLGMEVVRGILERYSGAMDLSAAGGSEILRIIINN